VPEMPNNPATKSSAKVRLKTYFFIVLMVIFNPMGNVLLSKGTRTIGPANIQAPVDLLHFFWRAITSATIWLGIACLLTFFVAYIVVLSWADYSFVQPASAITYVIVALMGVLFLHEIVKPGQWIGVGIICLGAFLVGNTAPSTTKNE
jgi:drug/metabolite transporter (DMT)-like permease